MKKSANKSDTHTQLPPASRRLPPLLRRAWYAMNQSFRRRIAHLKITPDQFTVLRWLTESPRTGLTQRQLTDLMASDANTIAALLKRMEAAQLVRRQPDADDRRANRVQITPAGRRVYQSASKIAKQIQSDLLSVLNEPQRKAFLESLEHIADAACRLIR